MEDVFFYEAFAEEEEALRACLPEGVSAGFTAKTIQEYDEAKPAATLISIRTQSVIPSSWTTQLAAVLSRSTGYDHLLAYAERAEGQKPALGYLPLYCSRAVAEQAMLMWLSLMRKLTSQRAAFERFERDGLTGREMQGKQLLVVGVGHIGSEIVRVGEGVGMAVQGVDPVRKHDFVAYTTYEEGAPDADVIVVAMNLTSENRGYFTAKRLALAKRGAVFVNIARGELSPPSELLKSLRSGQLGGVALDVYEDEADLAISLREEREVRGAQAAAVLEMKDAPNVICLPHNAFNTEEAVQRKAEQSVAQIRHFLKEGRFVWSAPGTA